MTRLTDRGSHLDCGLVGSFHCRHHLKQTFMERIELALDHFDRNSFTLLAVFNSLQIFGLSLVVVALTAWMSPRVHRISAWYSFMASWMFFCLLYFIMVGQQVGAEPPFGVCITQAALIYPAPAVTGFPVILVLDSLFGSHECPNQSHSDDSVAQLPICRPFLFLLGNCDYRPFQSA
ncbi:hypothetical protein DFH09DRAFT_363315 [Mycena vulgaris]|nr:hypothetical protein DFH09DRAFT_363315 [Mycena vulgaris]